MHAIRYMLYNPRNDSSLSCFMILCLYYFHSTDFKVAPIKVSFVVSDPIANQAGW